MNNFFYLVARESLFLQHLYTSLIRCKINRRFNLVSSNEIHIANITTCFGRPSFKLKYVIAYGMAHKYSIELCLSSLLGLLDKKLTVPIMIVLSRIAVSCSLFRDASLNLP